MAIDRTRKLRRPMRRGKTGIVRRGTKGIYDKDLTVRAATARAMVASREMMMVACALPDCDKGEGGQPKMISSRVTNGQPEAKTCCSAHRLKLWRRDMEAKGFKQRTVNGQLGWITPDGVFYPNPTQPKQRRDRGGTGRRRRSPDAARGPESG